MSNTYEYIIYLRDKMSGTMKNVGAVSSSTYTKMNKQQEMLNASTDRYGRIARSVFGGYVSMQGVKAFASLGTEIKQAKIQLDTLTGSTETGGQLFNNIQEFANRTPYLNRQVTNAATTLMAFGVANEKVIPGIKMIGDIAGGNSERFRALALAYAQSQSAGKLMGQDLLQMVNAGFNPLQEISQKTGLSIAQLRKEMEKGAISSQMVENAFRSATGEGGRFYGMMNRMSQESFGLWSTAMGQMLYGTSDLSSKIHDAFKPVLHDLVSLSQKYVKWTNQVQVNSDQVMKWMGVAKTAVKYYAIYKLSTIAAYKSTRLFNVIQGNAAKSMLLYRRNMALASMETNAYSRAVKFATLSWKGFSTAFKANAVGLMITGLSLVANKIIEIRNRTKEATEAQRLYNQALDAPAFIQRRNQIDNFMEKSGITHFEQGFKKYDLENGRGQVFSKYIKNSGIEELKTMQQLFDTERAEAQRKLENLQGQVGKKSLADRVMMANAEETILNSNSFLQQINEQVKLFDKFSGGKNVNFNSIKETSNSITHGGSRPTNITINIGNLVETLEVKTENVREGADEIQAVVQEQLLKALNSANYAVNPV